MLQRVPVPGSVVYVSCRSVWRVPKVDRSRKPTVRVRFPRTKAAGYPEPAAIDSQPFPSTDDEGVMFSAAASSYRYRHYRPTQLPVDDTQNEPIESCAHNPYEKERRKCLLCAHPEIEVNYKNPRLLSQFTSSFSGRTYDHHITGLCRAQQRRVLSAIKLSRTLGYMAIMVKNPQYLNDPQLFDPMKNVKPNAV